MEGLFNPLSILLHTLNALLLFAAIYFLLYKPVKKFLDKRSEGIAQALQSAGYTPGAAYPVLTGQDADKANVLNIIAGKQSMTVWKDTRKLGERVAMMIDQLLNGQTVEVNDEKTYDNGVKVVPTFLVEPQVVTKDTVESALVESGFYTKADLGL